MGNVQSARYVDINLPISFSDTVYAAYATDALGASATLINELFQITHNLEASTKSKIRFVTNSNNVGAFNWLAIGK